MTETFKNRFQDIFNATTRDKDLNPSPYLQKTELSEQIGLIDLQTKEFK